MASVVCVHNTPTVAYAQCSCHFLQFHKWSQWQRLCVGASDDWKCVKSVRVCHGMKFTSIVGLCVHLNAVSPSTIHILDFRSVSLSITSFRYWRCWLFFLPFSGFLNRRTFLRSLSSTENIVHSDFAWFCSRLVRVYVIMWMFLFWFENCVSRKFYRKLRIS